MYIELREKGEIGGENGVFALHQVEFWQRCRRSDVHHGLPSPQNPDFFRRLTGGKVGNYTKHLFCLIRGRFSGWSLNNGCQYCTMILAAQSANDILTVGAFLLDFRLRLYFEQKESCQPERRQLTNDAI